MNLHSREATGLQPAGLAGARDADGLAGGFRTRDLDRGMVALWPPELLRGGCLGRTRTPIDRVTTGRPTVGRQGKEAIGARGRSRTYDRLDVNELLCRAELLGHGAEGPNRTAAAQGFNLPLYS